MIDENSSEFKQALEKGISIEEAEHHLGREVSEKLTRDHLKENIHYYDKEVAKNTATYPRNEENVQTSIPPSKTESEMINPVNVGGKDNNFFKSDEPISGKIGGQFAQGTSAYNPDVKPNKNITVDRDAAIISEGATTTTSPGISTIQPTSFVSHKHKKKIGTHLDLRLSDGKSAITFSLIGSKLGDSFEWKDESDGVKLIAISKGPTDSSWLDFAGPLEDGDEIEEEDRGSCRMGKCDSELLELFFDGSKHKGRHIIRKTSSVASGKPVYLFWKPKDQTPSADREKLEESELSAFNISRVMVAKKGDTEIRAKDVLNISAAGKFDISSSSLELPSMTTLGDLLPIEGTDFIGKTEQVDSGKAKIISQSDDGVVMELRGDRTRGYFLLKKDKNMWSMEGTEIPEALRERAFEDTSFCSASASMRDVKLSLRGDNVIEGIALTEGIHNRELYPWEEIRKAYTGLWGKPLSYGHAGFVVGRVVEVWLDEEERSVKFKAEITDPMVLLMVKQGVFNSVSIGALAYRIPNEDGIIERRNLNFKELSIVPNPGCKLAKFKLIPEGYAS